MDPILTVVLIGALGGAVKSVLSYIPKTDGFDVVRFTKTVVTAAVTGTAVVYYTKINGVDSAKLVLDASAYIEAFLISMGMADIMNMGSKVVGKKL